MNVTRRRESMRFVPSLSFLCHLELSAFFHAYNPDLTAQFPIPQKGIAAV
jgi:hypothetical protein